jgi:hypothetical protein
MRTIVCCVLLAAQPILAQAVVPANKLDSQPDASITFSNQLAYVQAMEFVRSNCIQNRRIICGRIVKMLPGGLIVDSGYTDLMRQPLESNWLIPGTVETHRAPNLVEKNEPDCACAGLVFLTDIPRSRRAKPKVLDYVVLEGFPTGNFTYNSVGNVQRTVRRFSCSLPIATQLKAEAAGIHKPGPVGDSHGK